VQVAAGIDLTIVPYKGTAPAFQDLVGGQIEGFIDPLLGAMNFHKAGKLKIVAVTSKSRVVTLPDVPTVGETVPGYEFYSWYGLWGPAKLPAEVVTRLNAEVNKALAGDMRERRAQPGPAGGRWFGGGLRQVPARRHGPLAEDHHRREHPCRVTRLRLRPHRFQRVWWTSARLAVITGSSGICWPSPRSCWRRAGR
jgi:hypothetical protein